MNEKQIANKIIPKLLDLGFILHRYDSYSTSSIYLKLDYGICCGIRISDHHGIVKYRYRFNLIKDYKGNKVVRDNGLIRFYYTFNEINKLIKDVQAERKSKIQKYGIIKYKQLIEREAKNELFNRFKKLHRKD